MDLRTLVTISTLLFMTVDQTDSDINTTIHSNSSSTDSPSTSAPTTTAPPCTTRSPTPATSLIIIRWTEKCHGEVHLIPNITINSSSPVCSTEKTRLFLESRWNSVCESNKGCKGVLSWSEGKDTKGYSVTESGVIQETSCEQLTVQCTECTNKERQLERQLLGYKVVTALLCLVLIVLLLMRFTRPTIKALQRRLSDRRQNRWIGPTQSHSVSYHRGKTAVKNNDGEKRLSYPALERLTVSDSREPSSNRNSGYNF